MQSDIRRMIAVEAHRRRSGRCPVRIDSLGTGESFEIRPTADGFFDVTSGISARAADRQLFLPDASSSVDLNMTGDVWFDGYDYISGERFSGRAGGGASVTIYDRAQVDFFQYAVAAEGDST
jgi:hypothetical protein